MQILDCLGSLASNHSATDNKRFLTDLCLAEKHILCCHVSASVFNRISTPAFSQRTIIARIAEDSWSFPVGKEAIQKLPPVLHLFQGALRYHPLANKHSIELSETLPYPHVYFSEGSGMRNVVDKLFAKIGDKPQIAYETEEDEVIAGLVAQGFGIAVVPYMDMLMKLDIKIIQISSPVWERNFYMVNDDQVYRSPAVRSFRQFVLNGGGLK